MIHRADIQGHVAFNVTVLPQGIDENGLLAVSLFFRPQLIGGDATLASYPPINHWHRIVPRLEISYQFTPTTGSGAIQPEAAALTALPDATWEAIIRNPITVDPDDDRMAARGAGLKTKRMRSVDYPTHFAQYFQRTMTEADGSLPNPPPDAPAPPTANQLIKDRADLLADLGSQRTFPPPKRLPAHKRGRTAAESYEFHQLMAYLVQAPGILQNCGFIVRTTCSKPKSPASAITANITLPSGFPNISNVSITVNTTLFDAAGGYYPAGGRRVRAGMLDLTATRVELEMIAPTTDTIAAAADVHSHQRKQKYGESGQITSSALGRGVSLSSDAMADFVQSVGASSTLRLRSLLAWHARLRSSNRLRNDGVPGKSALLDAAPLNADAVTRGFAVDLAEIGVYDVRREVASIAARRKGGRPLDTPPAPLDWRGMCGRSLKYSVNDIDFDGGTYDSPVGVNAVQAAEQDTEIVHDTIVKYVNGISPVIATAPTNDNSGFPLDMAFSPTPPLPQLLFAHIYRARLRAVDISGRGRPQKDTVDDAFGTRPLTFGRLDAVQPPAVHLPSSTKQESEQATTLLLRRDAHNVTKPGVVTRHLLPASVPYDLAEMHGMLTRGGNDRRGLKSFLQSFDEADSPTFPDPMCVGFRIVFEGPDGVQSAHIVQFDMKQWPRIPAITLAFQPSDGAGLWDVTVSDAITVSARPGVTVVATMTAMLDKSKYSHMALLQERFFNDPMGDLRRRILARLDAAEKSPISPSSKITLRYATVKPTFAPRIVQNNSTNIRPAPAPSVTPEAAAINLIVHYPLLSSDAATIHSYWADWRVGSSGLPERYDASRVVLANLPLNTKLAAVDANVPFAFDDNLDQRHRDVRYVIQARSRFAGDFPKAAAADFNTDLTLPKGDDLRATSVVRIPSNLSPSRPNVTSIVTTFRWQRDEKTRTNTRRAGTIRFYLDRNWYETGDGEQFVVILSSDRMQSLNLPPLSWIAKDPIYYDAPSALDASFRTSAISPEWLRDDAGTATIPYAVRDANQAITFTSNVTARCYTPRYDGLERRWYVDLTVTDNDDTPTYMPFVGLAVARYQPISTENNFLSPIVPVSPFQPLPRRSFSVSVEHTVDNKYSVNLTVEAPNKATTGRSILAYVDQIRFTRSDNDYADSQELAWKPYQPMTAQAAAPGVDAFQLIMDFRPQGFRVRVVESELHPNDLITPIDPSAPSYLSTLRPRVVYVDVSDDLSTY